MENFNNDDVKKMLEMLKEQAKSTTNNEEVTQATENTVDSADDLKDLLKKQFSTEGELQNEAVIDDYSFDEVEDFVAEETVEEKIEEKIEEFEHIKEENELDDILKEAATEVHEDMDQEFDKLLEEIVDSHEVIEPPTEMFAAIEEEIDSTMDNVSFPEDEVISEESIDYDDVLEGQQGTVFNEFVEDLSGDLEDVVFEAEITDSHAPNKQYTIFEDWEELMKSKDFDAVEEDIIPPDDNELDISKEANQKQKAQTDYFNPVVSNNDLDAVDIALMVALGGKSELNETVGFEKIRQAVEETEETTTESLEGKKINGFYGEEYTSLAQNGKIRKTYKENKLTLIVQTVITAVFGILLLGYEIAGWVGVQFNGIWGDKGLRLIVGIALLLACFSISAGKLSKLFKDTLSFSSVSYIAALVALVLSIIHDALIYVLNDYAMVGQTLHSIPAMLLLLSLIYDLLDILQQIGVFNIIATSEKKLVLEPYGKIQADDDFDTGEMIEQDSYCISRVPNVKKYFERTQRPSSDNVIAKILPLIVSFSIAICVSMLILILIPVVNDNPKTALFSFLVTFLVLLACTSIFESEVAFFIASNILKKNKTGIIGKSSVAEHGKCNIVYFDDFNVFSKKSVRTKGLKLYDNNEIYRILYHTQAVFSKVGGPLKGVFEFATTEMVHSKNVEIKEISKEGISAIVDKRTSVLIGTGAFMRSRYIHPSYTASDIKLEEKGEESIMFIALNGVLGAKLYVTYQFSGEFEKLAKQLNARGINIGIRSADPNVNKKWAKNYGNAKKMPISIVRPTLKELKPSDKSIESGVVSTKNVRSLAEALMMCTKLDNFERVINNVRTVALVLMGILAFALILLSKANFLITMLLLTVACGVCASTMVLISYFYIKH